MGHELNSAFTSVNEVKRKITLHAEGGQRAVHFKLGRTIKLGA